MTRAAGIAAILGGLFLILAPRYILPVCEFQGYQPMHCSETARAELYAGVALAAAGVAIILLRRPVPVLGALAAAIGISIAALCLPGIYGYCKSPKMPCNYGTIPALRLVAAVNAAIALWAAIGTVRQLSRKDGS